jgi:hypothetical protein
MKKQGTESREQGSGIRDQEHGATARLLRGSIPLVGDAPSPPHDLWPQMQARLRSEPPLAARLRSVPWFDWALAAGLAVFALIFPAAVPMVLYYL